MMPWQFSYRYIWTWFTVVAVLLGAGAACGKKTPKYPEDHARFQRVVQAITTLQNAYIKQDASSFHELLLPLENLDILEARVLEDFDTFSDIHLDMTIDRILIDGDGISSFVSWQGEWQRRPEEPKMEAKGHGVLLWSGNQVILLRRTEGDLPFGMTHRPDFSS